MMKNNDKRPYLQPQLTVVTFATERGFATSGATLIPQLHIFEFGSSDPHVTQYLEDDNWAGNGWN